MGSLLKKKVLVTGGGQGLGEAIVEHFMDQGAEVVIHYRSSRDGAEALCKRAHSKGLKAFSIQADLCDEKGAKTLVDEAAEKLGGLDILINNAGDLVQRASLKEMQTELWEKIFKINVTSLMWVTRAAVPHLYRSTTGASIVNLGSLAGRKGGHAGSLAYSAAKGAVLTMTRSLASELGSLGIRVNAVAPGLILGTRFHNTHTTESSAQETIRGIPIGRAGSPQDVARAVTFLASEYDGFIHGATLDINGGVYTA